MESKTVVYTPEAGGCGCGSGMLGMLAPLLQKNGLDPNLLLAMNNKGNNGFGGDGSWFMWIIFLFFLFPLMGRGGWGNGFGGNDGGVPANAGLAGLINNDNGRELLMQAITGNGQAINSLATNLNCSVGQIQQAINGVSSKVSEVGCQVGMSSQQIINAIQSGNCQIANQMAQCCCDVKTAIQQQGYENQLATLNQTNTLTSNANTQFNIIGAKIDAQTQIINDKFCQLEMREMQREIQQLRDEKQGYQMSALTQQQTQNLVNQLRPCPVPAYLTCNPFGCQGGLNDGYNYGYGYPYGNGCNNGCGC
jgi:hypothetical protein